MQNTKQALKQDIKREVMRELQFGNPGYFSPPVAGNTYPSAAYGSRFNGPDPYARERLKQEIMSELAEETYPYPVPYPTYPAANPGNLYNQTIAGSIKNELMAEIEAQRTNQMLQQAGYGKVLSDQKLNSLIDNKYRTLDNIRGDLKKELQAIHNMERRQPVTDPYTRSIAEAIALEARQQGIPLPQVIQTVDGKATAGSGMWGRFNNMLNVGQRKGFLWGVGAAAVVFLLWPSARNNLHSVAVRSVEGGMSWADRARSFVGGGHPDPDFGGPDGQSKDKPDIDILQ